MPAPHPPEFRQRAVELARLRERPLRNIASSLGISESCLRNWIAQADIDDATGDERAQLERQAVEAAALAATLDARSAELEIVDQARSRWLLHITATRADANRAPAELYAVTRLSAPTGAAHPDERERTQLICSRLATGAISSTGELVPASAIRGGSTRRCSTRG